jgi:hypothetical protein
LVGKPDGKRSLGRPRHRWGDNIREHSSVSDVNASEEGKLEETDIY